MGQREDDTQDYTEPTDDNVGNSKERVLSSHHGSGGDEDRLGAAIYRDWEVCTNQSSRSHPLLLLTIINVDGIGASTHDIVIISQCEFAELGQTGSSHPDVKLLILRQIGNAVSVSIGISITPIWWRHHLPGLVVCLAVQ